MRLPWSRDAGSRDKDEDPLASIPSEELARECLDRPSCRMSVIEQIQEDVADALDATLVEAIKAANERTPLWWQWLLLFIFGAMAGVGLGVILAAKTGVVAPPPVPPSP